MPCSFRPGEQESVLVQYVAKMKVYPGLLSTRNYQPWTYSVMFNVITGVLIVLRAAHKRAIKNSSFVTYVLLCIGGTGHIQ